MAWSRSPHFASRWDDFVEAHPRFESLLVRARPWLPPVNFITIHYAYFVVCCLVASLVFWGSSNPAGSISYADSLYLVISAMTEAGLNTVNLSSMTTWQQVLLWLLIIMGSAIWVSFWTVMFRKHVFEQRFEEIVRLNRERRLNRRVTFKDFGIGRRVGLGTSTRPMKKTASEPLPDHHLPAMGTRLPAPLHGEEPLIETMSSHAAPSGGQTESLNEDDAEAQNRRQSSSDRVRPQPAPAPAHPDHISFVSVNAGRHVSKSGAISTSYETGSHVSQRRNGKAVADDASSSSSSASSASSDDHSWWHWGEILTKANVSRNSQFHDLSSEERERLGGCEYQALKILAQVVPLYAALWQALGGIAMGAYISRYLPETARTNAANPWWTGIFYAVSAFNNSGMALLDANMMPFQRSYFVLILMGLLILAGNTAFPLFLRLTIWLILKTLRLVTEDDVLVSEKATLEFILKYPRRVYTNLFPSRPTWWLLFMLILTNSVDWVAFEVMNIGNPAIEEIPVGPRIMDGLFQAVAVRAGGFYVVPISSLFIGLQVLYLIMMYISVYPVVITMRHSNVYEERSLGIYAAQPEPPPDNSPELPPPQTPARHGFLRGRDNNSNLSKTLRRAITFHGVGVTKPPLQPGDESRVSFINQQIRGQLAHDLWWLVVAIFAIVTLETANFLDDPLSFSVFNVIFEVVSAYGCVGISVGVPFAAFSFSGAWGTASKLVLCLVMLRGRHRGLPVALDRAVRLPGERLARDEEEDQRIRQSKTISRDVAGV